MQPEITSTRGPASAGIGVVGALSIGIGGIVGGGFFATFGLAVLGARGSTYLSFLIGGVLALLTAYSYVRLTLRYPGPGGTVSFVTRAFGTGTFGASVNRLLIFSYIALMAVYGRALGGYSASYLPHGEREFWTRIIAAAAIVALGLVNFAGAAVMARFERAFNISKLAVLLAFVLGGLFLGQPSWSRLGTSNWVSATAVIASGMVVFLSYEGFELIANASPNIKDPARTLPIAFYGSVLAAIVIYVFAVIVALGHMPSEAMEEARNFALSAAASVFLGQFGFGMMTFGAIMASASAINADFFGAEKLPTLLGEHKEMPDVFTRTYFGRNVVSMAVIGLLAVLAVYFVSLQALSAATSGGFLIVFAAVNLANVKLAGETQSRKWISATAALACVVAVAIMMFQFAAGPATREGAYAVGVIAFLSIVSVHLYRLIRRATAKM